MYNKTHTSQSWGNASIWIWMSDLWRNFLLKLYLFIHPWKQRNFRNRICTDIYLEITSCMLFQNILVVY